MFTLPDQIKTIKRIKNRKWIQSIQQFNTNIQDIITIQREENWDRLLSLIKMTSLWKYKYFSLTEIFFFKILDFDRISMFSSFFRFLSWLKNWTSRDLLTFRVVYVSESMRIGVFTPASNTYWNDEVAWKFVIRPVICRYGTYQVSLNYK